MGGKTQTTTSQLTIPKQVMKRYDYANKMARDAANNGFQQFGTDPSDFVAQMNDQQFAGMDTINNASNVGQQYFGAANDYLTRGARDNINPGELEIDKYMSPYLRQVVDSTDQLMNQQQEQQQSGQTGQAIMSGAFGGDRAGIGAANLAQQQMLARQNILSGLLNQGYNTALSTAQQQQGVALGAEQANADRMLMAGQGMAGLGGTLQGLALQQGQAQLAAGTQQQQTDQAGISALYNQFMQEQAYPFQTAQFLANIAMGTGALSGSTNTTTQPAPFFSDRRLKHDIKHIGFSDHGTPIYSFKYKGKDETHIGFMADEVEKKNPEAVGVAGGYKTVDYSKAHKFAEGGVVGPYASELGSTPGASSYVPQPYLEVRGLMTPDLELAAANDQSIMAAMEQAAAAGKNIASLRDSFGELKTTASGWFGNENYRGGLVRATGGGVFQPQAPVVPEVTENPINDVLAKQEQDNGKIASLKEAQTPPPPPSGAAAAGSLAGGVGSLLSGLAGIFALSDRRTKENVKRVGRTFKGTPIYSFNYKGDKRPVMGFMADEVEKDNPDAVATGKDGMKRVDYAKAHQFYRGGVVGYADGGAPMLDEQELIDQGLAAGLRLAGVSAMSGNRASIPAANQNDVEQQGLARGVQMAEQPVVIPGPHPVSKVAGVVPVVAEKAAVIPGAHPVSVAAAVAPPITETKTIGDAPVVKSYIEPKQVDTAYSPTVAEAYIRQAAEARGIDPDTAVRVAKSEGLGEGIWQSNVRKGDMREPSFGPFQLLVGDGQNFPKGMGNDFMAKTGMDPRDPKSWQAQVDFALDHAARNGWDAWNGAKAIGLGMRDGISETARSIGKYANEAADGIKTTLGDAGVYANKAVDGVRSTLGDAGKALSEIPASVGNKLEGLGEGAKSLFGKVTSNEDLMLSILSGLGGMASSPSRYLGAAILQGIGAGANTYAGLRKQTADIAKTQAETKTEAETAGLVGAQADVAAADAMTKKFFTVGPNGMPMVIGNDGRAVPLSVYLQNPFSVTLSPEEKALVDKKVQEYKKENPDAQTPQTKLPDTLAPSFEQETQAANGNYAGQQDVSTKVLAAASQTADLASQGRIPMRGQLYAITDALGKDGALGTTGTAAGVRSEVGRFINTAIRASGLDIAPVTDLSTEKDILEKVGALQSANMANQYGLNNQATYENIANNLPNLESTPEAAATIMADLMAANQRSIDYGNFARDYASDPRNTYKLATGAQTAFNKMMAETYQQEQEALKLFVLNGGKTGYMDLIKKAKTPEQVQKALSSYFVATGHPLPENSQLYRYFIGQ